MIYCRIADGVVVDRAVFAARMPRDWPDKDEWVCSSKAQIGWSYSVIDGKGKFTQPPAPEDLNGGTP